MTYTEQRNTMDTATTAKPTSIAKAVKAVLVQALEQNRVNCGVFECVDILDRETESVAFCVLPEGKSKDVTLRIQHTLIEAFCRENDVKLLKVDCATKLSTVFTAHASKETKERLQQYATSAPTVAATPTSTTTTTAADLSCVLVMNPSEPSAEDEFVAAYCENFMLGDVIPHGSIEIPA